MDIYHAHFDLKAGVKDMDFARDFARWMEHLKSRGLIEGWRLTRRKFGFGPEALREFHAMMEVKDLAQLDAAFQHVAARGEPAESAHFAVNSKVANAFFALTRDFPDAVRREGEEKF